jgi:dihydroorotase
MLIKNCRLVTSREIIFADVLIEGEKIVNIGRGSRSGEVIDAKNKFVIPGLVDVHVHMRDFEQSYKEDFFSGSSAALAGGITTFVDMPNSSPPATDSKTFQRRLEVASKKSLVDFGINFGITSGNLEESKKVAPVACKVYMDGTLGEINEEVLAQAIKERNRVAVHAEYASMDGKPKAEEEAVKKVCSLAANFKKPVHICHISCRSSLNYLNEYTTCEVTPHHLLLTERELKEQGDIARVNPPLRTQADNRALWAALKSERINAVASDHAPHEVSEKEEDALPGFPNLDVMLRLFLTLVNERKITIQELVRWMCENPAKIFGIKNKGEIKVGSDADLVILNMEEKSKIDVDEFYSKAKYSPFEGQTTVGSAGRVILRGRPAFEEGDILVKRGYGRLISLYP